MYFSCLEINTKNEKAVNWMTNLYRVHQRLYMAFEQQKNNKLEPDFLYHLEEDFNKEGRPQPRILVLSNIEPFWNKAFNGENFLSDPPKLIQLNLDNFIKENVVFQFSLKANPTKKIKDYRNFFSNHLQDYPTKATRENQKQYQEGKEKLKELVKDISKSDREQIKSKRVGIYKTDEQIKWLESKAKQSGFEILHLQFNKGEKEKAIKKQDNKLTHQIELLQVHFTGILKVTDAVAFKKAYCNGIGTGKAFGCGMLLLARG